MLTAKEAKNISDTKNSKMEKIMQAIENAANKGDYRSNSYTYIHWRG